MRCTVKRLLTTINNPNLNKLDLFLNDYFNAVGNLTSTQKNAVETMYNTLKNLGVINDLLCLYPVLGDSMQKAKINMMNVSKYASIGNNASYSDGVISSNNSTSLVVGNESFTIDIAKPEFTVFAAFKDNSSSDVQNGKISGICSADFTGIFLGGDKKYNDRAVRTAVRNNDVITATTNGLGTGSQGKILAAGCTKIKSNNTSNVLIYDFLSNWSTRSNIEKAASSLFEFTGMPLIGYNSEGGNGECYFLAILNKSLLSYGSTDEEKETMTNALFNCFNTFLQSCKDYQ